MVKVNQIPENKKGLMSGCGISSNKPHQKVEIVKELGPVGNELTVAVDMRRKGKNEHAKIIGWENDKHIACHPE